MKILGIDEAGRGPVIGPLIIAGVVIDEKQIKILERMGVKDSKRLTPARRSVLSRKIKKMGEYELVKISARDIDNLRAKEINLNEIEKIGMMKIIKKSSFDKVIIDSVDIYPERLRDSIKYVLGEDLDIISEHKADDNHIPVAAASIIAKVERDIEIERLTRKYRQMGPIGSGYPSDPKTKAFINKFTFDELPDFVRKSWSTAQKLKEKE